MTPNELIQAVLDQSTLSFQNLVERGNFQLTDPERRAANNIDFIHNPDYAIMWVLAKRYPDRDFKFKEKEDGLSSIDVGGYRLSLPSRREIQNMVWDEDVESPVGECVGAYECIISLSEQDVLSGVEVDESILNSENNSSEDGFLGV
jgi:hypothetical protein